MYKNKVILITGGTGSWGNELTKQLLNMDIKKIIIFSRGELAQVEMQRRFQDDRLEFMIGDIRDKEALEEATVGVDYIFHLAALKHVPVCEKQAQEVIKTNIIGTMNLVNASIKNKVKKLIDVSTDKAVAPLNLYGMSKGIGEKVVIQSNYYSNDTSFACIRAGNVLGSNGSVVPLFIEQIKKYNKITLTHKDMTRYFLTIPEAITLLFKAAKNCIGGEIFVMKMPSCKIIDLANVLTKYYGNPTTTIEETGIRPGEKLHEELISIHELCNTYEFDNNYYLIAPNIMSDEMKRHYNNFDSMNKLLEPETSLKDKMMTEKEIEAMLMKGNFLL